MSRRADGRKVSEWRARFERFAKAETSVSRFCRGEGVSVPSFYQWRKKLAARETTASDDSASFGSGSFAAVRLVGSASVAAWLPGGTRLEIPLGDPQSLTLVIETLVRADAEQTLASRAEHGGGVPC